MMARKRGFSHPSNSWCYQPYIPVPLIKHSLDPCMLQTFDFFVFCFSTLEDWDKPQHIPDPDAKKPDDWDDEIDGEWEPPMIDNPDYKVGERFLHVQLKVVCHTKLYYLSFCQIFNPFFNFM